MKNILGLFCIVLVLAACNNAADAEQRIKDSLDSIENLRKESVQEAADDAQENIEQRFDSLKETVDSVSEAVRDSI